MPSACFLATCLITCVSFAQTIDRRNAPVLIAELRVDGSTLLFEQIDNNTILLSEICDPLETRASSPLVTELIDAAKAQSIRLCPAHVFGLLSTQPIPASLWRACTDPKAPEQLQTLRSAQAKDLDLDVGSITSNSSYCVGATGYQTFRTRECAAMLTNLEGNFLFAGVISDRCKRAMIAPTRQAREVAMIDTNHWSEYERSVWQRIGAHPFERAGLALDFVARLAREHGWTRAYALAAIEEYRRFCFLAVVVDHVVSPGLDVDEVWHLHLTDSRDYWDVFCPQVLGCALHHEPMRGSADDARRHYAQYAQTLASYQQRFGVAPLRFWPRASEQFADPARWRRVDLRRVAVVPRWPRWARLAWRPAWAAPLLAATPRALADSGTPLDWDGPSFLKLFALLLIVAVVLGIFLRRMLRDNDARSTTINLTTAEIAYLAGGSERVLDSGIAELLARGDIRWDAPGQRLRSITRDSRSLEFPLDVIAAEVLAGTKIKRMAGKLAPKLERVRAALLQRGLLLSSEQNMRVRLLAALPVLAVGAFGLAKIDIGLARERPVAFLVVLCVFAAIIGAIFVFKSVHRSRAGDRALEQLREKNAHATRAPRDVDIAIAVAIAGTAVLSGTAYAAYHQHRVPPADNSGSGSSSDSSSGGGDSGGSGGCGGCGGGGD